MALIATSTPIYSNLVKYELEVGSNFTHEYVTANSATATTLKFGTVLGIVTATGKWKISVSGATDGSQNAAGVLLGDAVYLGKDVVLAAGVDQKVVVMATGPSILAAEALVWDASYDTQAKKDVALAALAAKFIKTAPQR